MTRPGNHPHRRLGALAELVRRWKEVRLLRPRFDEVAEWISGLSHPFWDYHFTLLSAQSKKRSKGTKQRLATGKGYGSL
jgi:hypothetical protein